MQGDEQKWRLQQLLSRSALLKPEPAVILLAKETQDGVNKGFYRDRSSRLDIALIEAAMFVCSSIRSNPAQSHHISNLLSKGRRVS